MDERRRFPRHSVLQQADIFFNDYQSVVTGTLTNLSETGALLQVDSVLGIPNIFRLKSKGLLKDCIVRHWGLNQVGVEFVLR